MKYSLMDSKRERKEIFKVKKIAIFVEGQTEQIFISKLIKEIANKNSISVFGYKLTGGNNAPKIRYTTFISTATNAKYEALIYDSSNDDKVKSDIIDQYSSLKSSGYSKILGLRDLYPKPLSDLPNIQRFQNFFPPTINPMTVPIKIIIAVMEIEAWFLAESFHYTKIDAGLTLARIISSLRFNPDVDDMTLRSHPSNDLHMIYQLVGKGYGKRKNQVERTVDHLDYENIYLNIQNKIPSLKNLIEEINNFL